MIEKAKSSTLPRAVQTPLESQHIPSAPDEFLDSMWIPPTSRTEILPSKERELILREGIALTTDSRNSIYGEPIRNMTCHGELIAVYQKYAGANVSAHDAAIFQVLAKIARIACAPDGVRHRDNYVDGATYMAIAYEVG